MTCSILKQHLINSSLTRCRRFVHCTLKYWTAKPRRRANRSQAVAIVEKKKRIPERARNSPAAGKYDARKAHSTQRRTSRASRFHVAGDLRAHSRVRNARLFLRGRRRMFVVSNRPVVKRAESRKAWLLKTKNTYMQLKEDSSKLAGCRSELRIVCLSPLLAELKKTRSTCIGRFLFAGFSLSAEIPGN